jgi:general secretion pathway protein J
MARRQRGFSLVEVLVALSLTSLLLTGLYSAFGTVARTSAAASKVQRATQDRRLVTSALRSLLANAVPLTERRGDRTLALFEGDRARARFVSHLPAHAGGGGLYFTEIAVETQLRGERSLTLQFRPAWPTVPFDAPTTAPEWSTEVLIEDVESVEIEYLGADDARSVKSWRNSWREMEELPRLVRLVVKANEDWPDLVVPLRAEVSEAMPYWHRDTAQVQ